MSIAADLRSVIYALSDALDLVGVDDAAHGKRVGIMAAHCGKTMGMTLPETNFLFDLGLLHDVGVSSTEVRTRLADEFDWEHAHRHAEAGYDLLAGFAPLAHMALPVRYHHTRWDILVECDVDPVIARTANLIMLVDRVDILAAPHWTDRTLLLHRERIRSMISSLAGTYFAPDLVDVFLAASHPEAFWLLLEPRAIQSALQNRLLHNYPYQATMNELRQLARIFARIVDAKSRFTADHSLGVASLARFLGEKLGISAENCDKLEIAGLLHDLGKLRIPDHILDKPTALDPDERLLINTHSFETYQILHGIDGFDDIARWAGYHHEEPDGSGYPFRITADRMPLEARILRVADIFQALVQDRPYRRGLRATDASSFLTKLGARGRVDRDVVATLDKSLDDAMSYAYARAKL